MTQKTNPFRPRAVREPSSQLSQVLETKRHRRLGRIQYGLQAAIAQACTNARTRKTRARAALTKSENWTKLTKEEQDSRVRTAADNVDLKLQVELHDLERMWNERVGTHPEEDLKMISSSDDDSEMEDGPVDVAADEPLFDADGNAIFPEAVDDMAGNRVRASEARLAKVIERFEKVGSFNETGWDSEDAEER